MGRTGCVHVPLHPSTRCSLLSFSRSSLYISVYACPLSMSLRLPLLLACFWTLCVSVLPSVHTTSLYISVGSVHVYIYKAIYIYLHLYMYIVIISDRLCRSPCLSVHTLRLLSACLSRVLSVSYHAEFCRHVGHCQLVAIVYETDDLWE